MQFFGWCKYDQPRFAMEIHGKSGKLLTPIASGFAGFIMLTR